MKNKLCMGCGEILQSDDINEKGYVPLEKYLLQDNLTCRRCFRLKNYGEVPKELSDPTEYKEVVQKSIQNVDVVLAIFDAIDLEASMTSEILDLLEDKTSLVVLNKMDLLPNYFSASEIANWFNQKIVDENIFPEAFCYSSAKSKFGLNGIMRKLKTIASQLNKKELKVCVLGASNVGKSSVLNNLIGKNNLTVSKYSGTTKKSLKTTVKYKDIKISFIDTPGIIPKGRLFDLLPSKKAVKLVPNREISRKTFKLNEGQYFMFSNLMYFRANSKCEIQVFASKNVEFHVTNENKVENLMKSGFFELLTEEETNKYLENKFIEEDIYIEQGQDLVIYGLGFIEIKKHDLDITIKYPEQVNIVKRDSISKIKRIKEEDEEIW